jgi:hypothetical protein
MANDTVARITGSPKKMKAEPTASESQKAITENEARPAEIREGRQ